MKLKNIIMANLFKAVETVLIRILYFLILPLMKKDYKFHLKKNKISGNIEGVIVWILPVRSFSQLILSRRIFKYIVSRINIIKTITNTIIIWPAKAATDYYIDEKKNELYHFEITHSGITKTVMNILTKKTIFTHVKLNEIYNFKRGKKIYNYREISKLMSKLFGKDTDDINTFALCLSIIGDYYYLLRLNIV